MSLTSSYLDHLDARLEKQGGRGSLSRLLLVARKGEAGDDPDAVVRYHERVSTACLYVQVRMICIHTFARIISTIHTWYQTAYLAHASATNTYVGIRCDSCPQCRAPATRLLDPMHTSLCTATAT